LAGVLISHPDAFIDWTTARVGRLPYSYAYFAKAKLFFYDRWCDPALNPAPLASTDLSGACRYGSIFMQQVFGGAIRGHFEHQYNFINGRLVDLSHDAADVGRMRHPYLHEPDYFLIPELQASLAQCLPRAQLWAQEFLADQARPPD
jgi:hypothetical protein